MFGIDELYEELLLEAKSPEEIEKIMRYQFVDGKGVPEEVFKQIFESDPTRKKNFAKWVLIRWGEESRRIERAIKTGRLVEIFNYFQDRANSGLNLLSMKTFKDANWATPKDSVDPIFDEDEDGEYDEESDNFDIIYDSPIWRIAVPNSTKASRRLGVGSKWCTAGYYGRIEHYYGHYEEKGKLYINFDKRRSQISSVNGIEYPYTRYQFCFEADAKGELQDLDNVRIVFDNVDMPDEVLEFYGSIDETYLRKLEQCDDEAATIRRYNEARMQHCALRKNGPNGQLLLLPEYNDEELVFYDDSGYCVFTEEDLTDPLDWGIYDPSTDIISTCGDAPMLVMRNSGGYDPNEINVYYLNSQSWRDNDNGYWSVLEDVEHYGDFDDVSYAIDSYFRRIYMAFPNEMSCATQVEIPFRDIDKMENITLDGMPSEYSSGKHWIKIYFENGFNGLFYIDTSLKDIKIIIKGDRPIGEEFVVENKNGKYIIRGKLRDYTLFSDDEDNGPNYNIVSTIGEDDTYYLISYPNENAPSLHSYGIFSQNDKGLIVSNAEYIDEFGRFALITYDRYSVIYDYINEKEVSKRFVQYKGICHSNAIAYIPFGTTDIEIFSQHSETIVGRFKSIGSEIGWYCIEVSKDGYNKTDSVLNTLTGSLVLGGGVSDVHDLDSRFLTLVKNGVNYVYDVEYDEVLTEFDPTTPIVSYGAFSHVYKYKMLNGKFNLFTFGVGGIIPGGADSILKFSDSDAKYFIIPFKNNNKWLFMYKHRGKYVILPSKHGIDTSIVTNITLDIPRDDTSCELNFTFKLDDGEYKVVYKPEINSIFKVNGIFFHTLEPEIQTKIEKIFHPDRVEISERFNNLTKRMNDL